METIIDIVGAVVGASILFGAAIGIVALVRRQPSDAERARQWAALTDEERREKIAETTF